MNYRQPMRLGLILLVGLVTIQGCGDGDQETVADAGSREDAAPSSDAGEDAGPAPVSLLAPGPYVVGFRRSALTYARAGTGEPRELAVDAWYPAAAGSTEPLARYVTGGLIQVPSQSARRAPAVADGGPFPLVIYSHGGTGEAQHAYPYGELLASHGFVLVSLTHTGTAAVDVNAFSSPVRWSLDRPNDISAGLDWLAAPTDTAFAGLATTDRVMVMGYSLGAYTTFAVAGAPLDLDNVRSVCADKDECALLADGAPLATAFMALEPDERVVALVAQAPGANERFVAGSLEALDLPLMVQSGRLDISTPYDTNVAPIVNGRNRAGDVFVDMAMGAHLTFIPTCRDVPVGLITIVRPSALDDGCGDGFISVDDALPVLAAYTLGFALVHLRGETRWQAELTGPPLGMGFEVTAR